MSNRILLHPHQVHGRELLRGSLVSGHRCPVLQAPTAFGKTVLMSSLVEGILARGKRVVITVPLVQLIDQTVVKLVEWGISPDQIGVIQSDHPMTNWGRPVQVASAQTLQRRKVLPRADVVIVDECHRWFKFYGDWMQKPEYAATYFVGMSATPWTKGLGKFFDDLVTAATTQDLIDKGFLSDFRVFAADHPDLTGIKTVKTDHGLDYQEGALSERMQAPKLTANAVSSWRKHNRPGHERPTLCFAVDCAHGQKLQEQFQAANIPCGYIDGKTPQAERTKIEIALKHGRLKVVVNIGCLTMGCDWPFVSCISLCRPTKSEMLYVQIMGRGLRVCEGKSNCIILDHSDTTARLGLVTDIVHDELDDGDPNKAAKARKRSEQRERPDECLGCGALRRKDQKKCWSCGFEAKRPSKIEHAPGELKEVTKAIGKVAMAEKQAWWSGFLHVMQYRSKTHKWALAQYKQKFGVWPRNLRDIPMEPTAEMRSWMQSRQIAFAKGRQKYGASNQQEVRP